MCVSRGASYTIKNLIIDSTSDAVVVRKGNHPFKAVLGIQSQRNILSGVGHPVVIAHSRKAYHYLSLF